MATETRTRTEVSDAVTVDDLLDTVEVDCVAGVETLWVPRPGPLTATLVFGVGTLDEPVQLRGATHLLEHGALEPLHAVDFAIDGSTSLTHTQFSFRGTSGEVVYALEEVTSWLARRAGEAASDPHHADVLQIEQQSRGGPESGALLRLLYGFDVPGTATLPEYGVGVVTPDELEEWSARWFTAANARLVLSGPPPSDLRLHLPADEPPPARPGPMPAVDLPAWSRQTETRCVVALVGAADSTGALAAGAVHAQLQHDLRHGEGVTYSVVGNRLVLGADGPSAALTTLELELRAEECEDGAETLVASLQRLGSAGPARDVAERVVRRHLRGLAEPDAALGIALGAAQAGLLGRPLGTWLADLRAPVDVDQIIIRARDLVARSLVVAPAAPPASGPVGWTEVPQWSSDRVMGRRHAPCADCAGDLRGLVAGDDGVTLELAHGCVTVRFEDCVAVLHRDDGSRTLLGADGFVLPLAAERWPDIEAIAAHIDTHAHAPVIDCGPRDPATVVRHAAAQDAGAHLPAGPGAARPRGDARQARQARQARPRPSWLARRSAFALWLFMLVPGRLIAALLTLGLEAVLPAVDVAPFVGGLWFVAMIGLPVAARVARRRHERRHGPPPEAEPLAGQDGSWLARRRSGALWALGVAGMLVAAVLLDAALPAPHSTGVAMGKGVVVLGALFGPPLAGRRARRQHLGPAGAGRAGAG